MTIRETKKKEYLAPFFELLRYRMLFQKSTHFQHEIILTGTGINIS